MKNIQVIDAAENCVYDIFQATASEFAVFFPDETDIAFIEEVMSRHPEHEIKAILKQMWKRRIAKRTAIGIHGTLFFQLESKKIYYPTRKDEEAINPDVTRLRQ